MVGIIILQKPRFWANLGVLVFGSGGLWVIVVRLWVFFLFLGWELVWSRPSVLSLPCALCLLPLGLFGRSDGLGGWLVLGLIFGDVGKLGKRGDVGN